MIVHQNFMLKTVRRASSGRAPFLLQVRLLTTDNNPPPKTTYTFHAMPSHIHACNMYMSATYTCIPNLMSLLCLMGTENADGSVLFQFEPNVTHSQVGTAVKVLSVGKQRKSLSKLERIANGENMHSQLKYKLWEPASTANTPYDRSASTSASAADQSSDAQQASHRLSDAAVNNHSEDSPTGAQPQMNGHAALEQRQDAVSRNARETLSLLLGQNHSPLSSDRYSEPELSRQYAFATTRDSSAASATQPSSLQKPALLQKPVRPAAQEPPTSAPLAQDYSRSYAGREHEKRVPCYLWHESGVPKRVELSSFSTEGASEDSDEAVSTSDSPSTIAESGAGFSQHQTTSPAPDNAVQKAWKPIRQFLLWLWRLLPYWFRKLLVRSQQWEPPSVHASAILSQHATSQHRRHAVKGSTYDIVSGQPYFCSALHCMQCCMLASLGGWQLLKGCFTRSGINPAWCLADA